MIGTGSADRSAPSAGFAGATRGVVRQGGGAPLRLKALDELDLLKKVAIPT